MIQIGRIDVHTHLLPGIDDGCPTYTDSIACARALVEAGFTHAFCTPHVWPDLPHNNVTDISARVATLQQRLDDADVPLTVLPGGELNLVWIWPMLQKAPDQLVTYGMKGHYVLFDFWADRMIECAQCLDSAIRHLQEKGLTLIMAHPERVAALHADPGEIDRYAKLGVKLQMNTWCLTDPKESPTYRIAERLLKDGRYFLFGTDTHNFGSIPNRIRGIEIAEQMVGQQAVDILTMHNPAMLLPDTESDWPRTQAAAR